MMESGARCVMVDGTTTMQLSCVCNWDFKEQVMIRIKCMTCMCMYQFILYTDATGLRGSYFGDGTGPYHLSNVGCRGEERSLLQCISSSNIGIHTCSSNQDAGVRCDGN